MTADPNPGRFIRSPLFRIGSAVVYLVCLVLAIGSRNVGLGVVAILGIGVWSWSILRRNDPPKFETRDEALDHVSANPRRYAIQAGLLSGIFLLPGAALVFAGIRADRPVVTVLGGTSFCCGLVIVALSVRVAARLREHRG
jgi:hypothetical protein